MDSQRVPMSEREFLALLMDQATISGVRVQNAVIADSAAAQLRFDGCVFDHCTFTGVEWDSLACASCTFARCYFGDAHLSDATFTGCQLFETDSSEGCVFKGTRLHFVTFDHCTLDSCIFDGADLFNVAIRDSRAIGANFAKAVFGGVATLAQTALRYADLSRANLRKANLSHSDLEWAILDRANLQEANCQEATFNQTSIRGADFRRADLRNATLGAFDVRLADVRGALIGEGQMQQLLETVGLVITPYSYELP